MAPEDDQEAAAAGHGPQQHRARAPTPPTTANATVLRAAPLSPTVRSLVLKVDDHANLDYAAGQWVDFEPEEGLPNGAVGGFSMCAAPSGAAFRERRELELAVKLSRHPASAWVHDPGRCVPGARVRVQPGGTFTVDLARGCGAALFVAGGIGVTALAAMAGELCERWATGDGGSGPQRAAVLYSARSREELALLPRLREWAARARADEGGGGALAPPPRPGRLSLQLHLTAGQAGLVGEEEEEERAEKFDGVDERWRRGRITPADAAAAVDALAAAAGNKEGAASVGVFVCGPPAMTDELAAALARHPLVGEARVFTEKWW